MPTELEPITWDSVKLHNLCFNLYKYVLNNPLPMDETHVVDYLAENITFFIENECE